MRRLSVLVDHLPHESATTSARLGTAPGWSLTSLMTADVFHAVTGKPHPARPKPRRGGDGTAGNRYRVLRARLEAQRARQARAAAPVADRQEEPPTT